MTISKDRTNLPEDASAERLLRIRRRLMGWYERNRRPLPWRETDDPYRIWVSEVMLQQTRVNAVIPYYHRFLERFPDIHRLADADSQEVLKLWEGLGYYARARNLHRAARRVVAEYQGRVPDDWHIFLTLPGVGEYIASAVQSIAFDHPHAVVDGNVKRVLARLFRMEEPVNLSASWRRFRETATALMDPDRAGQFNQAVMELGALICLPKQPDCPDCPVQSHCSAYRTDQVASYPRRVKKKPVPTRKMAIGVVHRDDTLLIVRRKNEGLLGGLWEFPGGEIRKGETAEAACVRAMKEQTGLGVAPEAWLTRVRHAYTHFKVVAEVFHCRYVAGDVDLNGPVDYRWIRPDQIGTYPFPKVNHGFIPLLGVKD